MASKVIVLALVLVAIAGIVSADTPAPSTSTTPSPQQVATSPLPASEDNDVIGNTDGDAANAPSSVDVGVVAGPLGNGLAEGPFGPAAHDHGGASALALSTIAGVAAVAGYFAF